MGLYWKAGGNFQVINSRLSSVQSIEAQCPQLLQPSAFKLLPSTRLLGVSPVHVQFRNLPRATEVWEDLCALFLVALRFSGFIPSLHVLSISFELHPLTSKSRSLWLFPFEF